MDRPVLTLVRRSVVLIEAVAQPSEMSAKNVQKKQPEEEKKTKKESSDHRLDFWKYEGTGNDFIVVDNSKRQFEMISGKTALIKKMCSRHFGIGADGLLELRKIPEYDYEIKYYNADGNEGTFCGNGARCSVVFAKRMGWLQYNEAKFKAADGDHFAQYDDINGAVHLRMRDVNTIVQYDENNFFVDTGSPHHVRYVGALPSYDAFEEGKKVRRDDKYKDRGGTNVNFVEEGEQGRLNVRTFERGVENETMSCGTGVVASALVHVFKTHPFVEVASQHVGEAINIKEVANGTTMEFDTHDGRRNTSSPSQVSVLTCGGVLKVTFERSGPTQFTDVMLVGPANRVYRGSYRIAK